MQIESKVPNLAETISYVIEVSGIREHFENDRKEA